MELLPYKINVALLYPPNTETEGFKQELETMPEETQLISEAAGLFSPEDVAKAHVDDIEAGNYATCIGLDGWMLGRKARGQEVTSCRCPDGRRLPGEESRPGYGADGLGRPLSRHHALLLGLFQRDRQEVPLPPPGPD